MKKTLLLLAIIAMSKLLVAQDVTLLLSEKTLDKDNAPLDSVIFNYDDNNQLIEEEREYYSATKRTWVKSRKKTFTYEDGLLKQITHLSHDGTDYGNLLLYTYHYSALGATDSVSREQWRDGKWNLFEKDIYQNNKKKLPTEVITYTIDENLNAIPKNKVIYSYDLQDRETLRATHRWNSTKEEFELKTEWILDYWNGKLEKESRRELLGVDWYNVDYFYYQYTSFGEIKTRGRYIASTNQINDTKYYRYNKKDESASVTNVKSLNQNLKVYPNPFNDVLSFDLGNENYDIVIQDINGKKMLEMFDKTGVLQIDKQHLPQGIYFYQIINNKGIQKAGRIHAQ